MAGEVRDAIASKISYAASSGLTFFGVFTAQELAALVGIVLAVSTFFLNWYYQHQRHQLLKAQTHQKNIINSSEEDHRSC